MPAADSDAAERRRRNRGMLRFSQNPGAAGTVPRRLPATGEADGREAGTGRPAARETAGHPVRLVRRRSRPGKRTAPLRPPAVKPASPEAAPVPAAVLGRWGAGAGPAGPGTAHTLEAL
ncbi:hypothetical protein GCM10009605_20560 [Nocardiopsis composta]